VEAYDEMIALYPELSNELQNLAETHLEKLEKCLADKTERKVVAEPSLFELNGSKGEHKAIIKTGSMQDSYISKLQGDNGSVGSTVGSTSTKSGSNGSEESNLSKIPSSKEAILEPCMHKQKYIGYLTNPRLYGGELHQDGTHPTFSFIQFENENQQFNIYCRLDSNHNYLWQDCVKFIIFYNQHHAEGKKFIAKIINTDNISDIDAI
tara:strand:- start:86 stop:709 length:624 start_codon:yes stop_codon:yes gene_type:complete